MGRVIAIFLLSTSGCLAEWEGFDSDEILDRDGDGWTAEGGDCDDNNDTIHPDAAEVCDPDDVDEDCDGVADDLDPGGADRATETWPDADADGYGDASAAATAYCDPPAGHVAEGGDCDDADEAVYPDAGEDCATAWDDDCDGVSNEPDAAGCALWYVDADGDGYGDEGAGSTCLCEPSGHYAAPAGGDCDDGDGAVNPGAEESCLSPADEDCDGEVAPACRLEGTYDLGDLGYALTTGEIDDGFGLSLAGVGDATGDGLDDLVVSAPWSDAGAGAIYLIAGPLTGSIDDVPDRAYATLRGERAGYDLGMIVAPAGDVDGDGAGELLIVGYYQDDTTSQQGSGPLVYVVPSPLAPGAEDISAFDEAALYDGGVQGQHYAQVDAAPAGDVDGDGFDDLLVGYVAYSGGGSDGSPGAVHIIHGPVSGQGAAFSAGGAHGIVTITGAAVNDRLAACAGVGDVDGDGASDVLLGARYNNDPETDAGAVYLVRGPVTADRDLSKDSGVTWGGGEGEQLGAAVAPAGDFDRDGAPDLLIGSGAGIVYVVSGASAVGGALADGGYIARIDPTEGESGVGLALDSPGDLDADGYSEILIGSRYFTDDAERPDVGAAYLIYGGISGASDLADHARLVGDEDTYGAGVSLSGAGDLDGDGYLDLVVGGVSWDHSAAGRAWTVLSSRL